MFSTTPTLAYALQRSEIVIGIKNFLFTVLRHLQIMNLTEFSRFKKKGGGRKRGVGILNNKVE